MIKLTKEAIVDAWHEESNKWRRDCLIETDAFIDAVKSLFIEKGEIKFCRKGFRLVAVLKEPRAGRDFKTKQPLKIKRRVSFSSASWEPDTASGARKPNIYTGAKRAYKHSDFVNDVWESKVFDTKQDMMDFLSVFTNMLNESSEKKIPIELRGLLTVKYVQTKDAIKRNPKTGELVPIAGRLKPHVKVSPSIRKEIEKRLGV